MKDPVLFLVLDAFRWDYLDPRTTPFLWRMAQAGTYVRRVITASGFTQRSAIFTGAWADVTGHWTMHTFDPEHSPFRFLRGKRWPRLANRTAALLPGVVGRVFEARIRSGIYARARAYVRHPATARIPLHVLPHFAVSEDSRPVQEPGAFGVPTVFDRFHAAGLSVKYLMYPEVDGTDDGTEAALVRGAADDHHAYFGLLSGADQAGHAFGPDAAATAQACARLDARLRRIDAAFRRAGRTPRWLAAGDHGMLEVVERVDVLGALRRRADEHALVEGRDWIAFLDSTTARVWRLTDRADAFVDRAFDALGARGSVLDAESARRRRIPFGDRRYGDRAWLAAPGVLIRPDYFHRREERVKGMHGYDPAVVGQKGFAVVHGEGIAARTVEEAPLVDLCATLCALLGVTPPEKNEGRSWIEPAAVEAR